MQTLTNWATSRRGRAIPLFSSLPVEKMRSLRPLLLIGGVHGDEPEGVRLAGDTLAFLERERSSVRLPWLLIPCLNPDGIAAGTRGNGAEVDLNRNYPSRNWSPACEKPRYHPGASPASEPEIQALTALIREQRPRLIIHCHSWKPCLVIAGEPARRDAERLARASGYAIQTEIGYPTPGALSQYAWGELGIPVICVEEEHGCLPDEIWPRFAEGMRDIFSDASMR